MALIKIIKLKNFRGFREPITINFRQSTYLVGVNNAGKTNILHAIKAFFDDNYFVDESFLNKTEFLGRRGKYNQCEISLSFDLRDLTTKNRKASLIKSYGNTVELKKMVTFAPKSESIQIKWTINGSEYTKDTLPPDIQWLLSKIKVTYIHPQEGQNLFDSVQKRLRQRLLQNWGRGAALTHNINELQEKWIEMRAAANKYLSKSLSDSLQSFWTGCKVNIDLPKSIADVINVSDINFQGEKSLPEIQLTSQGTGAQSTVLYLAQYLLDSDLSLNKGEYHPVWLMEEPESFLHADLLSKISNQINSDSWVKSIQMVISTHSPILLASSRIVGEKVIWNILKGVGLNEPVEPSGITDDGISKIGSLMGDSNFFAYFVSAQKDALIFLEDEKKVTRNAFEKMGVPITESRGGISEIGRYIDIFLATPEILIKPAYFIVDADKGKKQIKRHIEKTTEIQEIEGFKKLKLNDAGNIFIIVLREGETVENLFDEFENHVRDCVSEIWNDDFTLKKSISSALSGAVGKARKCPVTNAQQAFDLIRNEQDVKDMFWLQVESSGYKINVKNADILKKLLNLD